MKIAVHDGRFYADDVFSVAAMMVLEPNLQVIRSRDPKVLAGCDLVIGVGGEYCPTRNIFDYHQKGGVCCRENGIPYSGFGLLWKHFGERICGDSGVALRVEQLLVQQIDAGDRGVGELQLSHLILQFNPSGLFTLAQQDEEFFRAVLFARGILQRTIRGEKTGLNLSSEEISRIESERICLNSLREREDSRIVVLPQFCSWKRIISQAAEALFVIFPNFLGEMMIQCVPPPFDNFSQKKPLPREWAGLQGDDFVQETGVPDAIFCHRRRFIGGAKFLEGALALAKLACQA